MIKAINQSRRGKEKRAYFIGKFAFRVCPLHPELTQRFQARCWVEKYLAKGSVIIKFSDGYRTCTGRENIRFADGDFIEHLRQRAYMHCVQDFRGSVTAKQTMFIVNLAQRKGLQSAPANILRWSSKFASKYISYLLSLPDSTEPQRFTPPFEADINHRSSDWSKTDMLFNSQRRAWRNGEYYSDGLDDIPVTKSLNPRREQGEL